MIAPGLKRNGWTQWHFIGAALMGLAGLAATIEPWRDIYEIAMRDEESSHIMLVPIVMAWLIWVRRGRMRYCRPTGRWIGPVLVGIGWAMHTLGDAWLMQSVWHAGAVVTVVGCVLSVLGAEVAKAFLPALLVLAFLVPVPGLVRQRIAIPLQSATALITEQVLLVLELPISRSGSILSINGVEVAIAEACNGLRMVFALLLVSFAVGFGMPLRSYARAIILLATPATAIFCNVVRLVPTVYLHGYAETSTADTFHDVSGWLMLGVSLVLLMLILRALRWALVPVTRYTLATN
ncbi:MAG: exosortase/archaeosortase family protein [Phycisphaeraceae bacterium]